MKFFFDANTSPRLAKALRTLGEGAVHSTGSFSHDTPDEDLIKHIGRAGQVLVTRDKWMHRNPAQRDLLKKHKVRVFFVPGNLRICEEVQFLARQWPKIKHHAHDMAGPMAYVVPKRGNRFREVSLG